NFKSTCVERQILESISLGRLFLLEICLRRHTKLFPKTSTEILRVTKTDLIGDFCNIIQSLIQQYFGFLKPHVPHKLHRSGIGQTFEFFIERIPTQIERIRYLIDSKRRTFHALQHEGSNSPKELPVKVCDNDIIRAYQELA